uniref:Uncharacterized protein n=1 Tax=Rhizophora mucronata TaxID=61149 RepID=A0A2P2NNL9_RHIMU
MQFHRGKSVRFFLDRVSCLSFGMDWCSCIGLILVNLALIC